MANSIIVGDSNSVFIEIDGFKNLAFPGFKTEDVLSQLKELNGGKVLIIGVGVNDSAEIIDVESGNVLASDIINFEGNYRELIKLAKHKFNKVICIGLISSTEKTVALGNALIQYKNTDIIKFSQKIEDLCKEFEVEFISLLPRFIEMEDELLADHIHPNKDGQDIVMRELKKCLN